jgi:DNA-3-methyladenine glycosylase II
MTKANIPTGAEVYLSACDPAMRSLIGRIGPSRLVVNLERSPYEALLHAVAHQQLHGKAAAAILGRVFALFPDHPVPPPEALLDHPEPALRGCGLSAAKLAAMRDIARKTIEGVVPDRALAAGLSDQELIERLTSLRGVGRWTVEMLLIFTLGRPDILPIDDFGVREGYRKLKNLEQQPKPSELAKIGEIWSPFRSTAAWYLWRASEFKP